MPTLETLSRKDIESFLSTSVLNKARSYQPRTGSLTRKGNQLSSKVLGSSMYNVEIQVDSSGILATCTCPMHSACKHIGAVLLRWIENPHLFRVEVSDSSPAGNALDVRPVALPPPSPPTHTPAWIATPFAERQTREREFLRKTLNNQTVAELRNIAATRGWRLSGTRKSDIVEQLLELVESVGEMAKAIYSLDVEHQQVLRSLALHSGSQVITGRTVEQTALAQGPLTKYDKSSGYVYDLINAGLAFSAMYGTFNIPDKASLVQNLVPFALARHFPPLLETIVPATWELEKPDASHTVHLAEPMATVRTIQNLLLLFEQVPPDLRPPQPRPMIEKFYHTLQWWDYVPEEIVALLGQPSINIREKSAVLTVPPPGYALTDQSMETFLSLSQGPAHLDFLYALLAETGLVQTGSPVKPWPAYCDPYLALNPEKQHAALVRSYFQMHGWTELWEVQRRNPLLRAKRRTNGYQNHPEAILQNLAEYRRLVLRLLAYLPDSRWVLAEKIAPLLQAFWTRISSATTTFGSELTAPWFLTWDDRQLNEENSADWVRGPGAFFAAILRGPLHWLGLADLVLAGDEIHAFRLRGLADLYWDRVEAVTAADIPAPVMEIAAQEQEQSPALSVDKQGQIRIDTAVITSAGHSVLRRVARVVSSMVGLFVYKLDKDTTYTTFQSGVTAEELVVMWNASLPVAMPRAVRNQLLQWWQSYGQTRIYRDATIIEFSDDFALTEMKAVTSLEKAIVAELSPRLVLIDRNAVTELVAQLEKAGYTPKVN